MPEPFLHEDQVQPAPNPEPPVPLAPEGCESDWKACLDAGQDRGPTSAHADEGWRNLPTTAV